MEAGGADGEIGSGGMEPSVHAAKIITKPTARPAVKPLKQ